MISGPKCAVLLFIVTMIFSLQVVYGWNPFSKSDWEDVGNKIKGGFETIGDKFKDAFEKGVEFAGTVYHDAKSLGEMIFKKIVSCTKIVGLGTEWTAKKAAYETAKATLEAGDKLKVLDPRVLALQTSEIAAKASLEVAQKTLDAAQKSAEIVSKSMDLLATGLKKGFNVKKVSIEANLSELIKAKTPTITLQAEMFGQTVNLNNVSFDFSNQVESAKNLMLQILGKVKGAALSLVPF